MSRQNPRELTLLLGRDNPALDTYTARVQRGGSTAAAISAGSSPSLKGQLEVPNEDALLVVDEGARTLLAVCDAHFGHESSHELLERLGGLERPLARNPVALFDALLAAVDPSETARYASETTLLAAVWDRDAQAGFGFSFGDSTLMVLGLEATPQPCNRKSSLYVRPCAPASLEPRRCHEFEFRARPGELIVAFTDGINECHYGRPDTSIQPRHMQAVLIRSGSDPEPFVRGLTELALSGVEGNPGGEDNIALITSLA